MARGIPGAERPSASPVVQVLGAVEFLTPTGPTALGGPVQRAVLALLALEHGRSIGVEEVLREIWGPDASTSERRSLATLLSRLRRITEPFGWTIEHRSGAYTLHCDGPATDARQFLDELERSESLAPEAAAGVLESALARWSGAPLTGITAPFADRWRRRLSDDRHRALMVLARALGETGRHTRAIGALEELAQLTPYDEPTWVLLIETLHRAGRPDEALQAYRRADRLLRDDLGIDPGPALRAAELAVLHRDTRGGEQAERSRPLRGRTPFVGRFAELVAVRSAIDASIAAGPSSVGPTVVLGPPGFGKTRLIDEALQRLPPDRRVVRGACAPEDSSPGVAILTPLARAVGLSHLDDLGPAGHDLRQLVEPGHSLDREVVGLVRTRLAACAVAAARLLCRTGALVVAVDDVHEADSVTRQVLEELAGLTGELPMALVLGERTGNSGASDWTGTTVIEVGEMARADLLTLAAHMVGPDATDDAEAVADAAGGSPLLAEQLGAELTAATGRVLSAGGLRGTVESRLATMEAHHVAVIEVAAVDGIEFDLRAVAAAAETTLAEAGRAVDRAGELGLVRPSGAAGSRFAHALVRDLVADRSGPATAAVHHAALARSYAALGNVLAAGHHGARGVPLLDPGLCASLLLAGATAALDVGRIDDAARWFELAVSLPGLDPSQRLDARIGLGATLLGMGDPRGREEIEATRRDALRGRRWPQAADAICRGTRLGDPVDTEAVRNFTTTAESVLDGLAQSDPLRSTRLLSQLVHAHILRDVPAAAEYLRRLEQLPPCNEVGAAAEVHVVQQVCAYRLEVVAHPADPGHLSAGAALRATFEREGALVAAVLTATIEVAAHLQVGSPVPGSVRAAIEGGAERLGRPDLLLALELADLGVTIGSEPLEAADLRLGEVLALATQLGTAPAVLFHTIALRREQLRAAELLPLVMAMGMAAPGPSVDVVASICLRQQDETVAAADRLEAATAALVAGRTDWTSPGAAALVLDESSSVGAPLTDTAADRCASLLEPHHGAMLLVAQVGMHLGPADRYLALAAAARGDLRRFDQLNRDATALARTAGLTNWAAWCELDRLRGGLDDVDVAALRRTARRHGAARLLQQLDLLNDSR